MVERSGGALPVGRGDFWLVLSMPLSLKMGGFIAFQAAQPCTVTQLMHSQAQHCTVVVTGGLLSQKDHYSCQCIFTSWLTATHRAYAFFPWQDQGFLMQSCVVI